MPTLETPPNPSAAPPPLSPVPKPEEKPATIRSAHFGEMEQHELVQLLDSLEDDRSKSQFREAIYISLFVYILLFWFLLYGPRLHTPQVVPIATHKTEDQLTSLTVPADLRKFLNRNPTPPSPRSEAKPAPRPEPRPEPRPAPQPRATAPTPAPRPAPTPQPAPTTTPRPATPTPTPPRANLPSAPTPRPTPSNIPDAPAPSQNTGRPNFDTSGTAADSIANAVRNSTRGGGGGGVSGPPVGKAGISNGYEILSDTRGVDFDAYIRRLLAIIRANWIPLLPEETYPPLSKQGVTLIRFGISKDGTLLQPHLDGTSRDRAIDLAAWGALQANGKFPPLPAQYDGQELDLRVQFNVNTGRRNSAE